MSKVYESNSMSVDCGHPRSGRFGARLDLCGNGVDNHILLITLKVYLKQATAIDNWVTVPAGVEVEKFKWTVTEWADFQKKFKACGDFWHRRFCLIPPDNAKEFKDKSWLPLHPDYMPNVECHFQLEFCGVADRHWEVAVLKSADQVEEASNTGIGKAELDSKDVDAKVRKFKDGKEVLQTAAAHEIGHMLGQPHVGALLKTNDCMRALELELAGSKEPVASYLLNGHNASACYGFVDGKMVPGVGENIMGLGNTVAAINAVSWEKALAKLVWNASSLPAGWTTAVRSRVDPRRLN